MRSKLQTHLCWIYSLLCYWKCDRVNIYLIPCTLVSGHMVPKVCSKFARGVTWISSVMMNCNCTTFFSKCCHVLEGNVKLLDVQLALPLLNCVYLSFPSPIQLQFKYRPERNYRNFGSETREATVNSSPHQQCPITQISNALT
jgi:hypothetical protein